MNTGITTDDIRWAQSTVLQIKSERGNWRAVAEALAPHHVASASSWWSVSQGAKLTPEKLRALRAFCGAGPVTAPARRSNRERGLVSVTPATAEQNGLRRRLGVTWRDVIDAGLQALEREAGE